MKLIRRVFKGLQTKVDMLLDTIEHIHICLDIDKETSNKYSSVREFFKYEILNLNASGGIPTSDLVNKIYMFCELYSGVTMYAYQEQFSKRLIRSVLDNDGDEITALFSRQSGKSETVATTVGGMMIILPQLANMPMFADDKRLMMFKNGLWVGVFAPSMRQAQITYNRMRNRMQSKSAMAVLEDPDFRLQFSTSNGQTVALTNGSFATSISASEGSNIEGESFKFIICEECQDISNYKIRKSIHPMGAAYNATIAKIGTATTFKGDFYEAIQRNIRDYKEGKLKIKNHFEYTYKVVMKYNPKYEKYVMKEMYRLGEDSDEFQMAYNLKWILQRGMFVDIDQLESKNGQADKERVSHDLTANHVAGIDLAGKDDSTVITIVEVDWSKPVINEERLNEETGEMETFKCFNTMIKDWYEINGDDYNEQYYEILDYLQHFKLSRIVIDATKESSVAHRMRANLSTEVIPFVFSSKSKSELYKHLDREIKANRAMFPCSPDVKQSREYMKFTQQLGELQKGYSGSYLVVAHPPERGAHDDYPDSWALAVYGTKDEGDSTVVESTQSPFKDRSTKSPVLRQINRLTSRRR